MTMAVPPSLLFSEDRKKRYRKHIKAKNIEVSHKSTELEVRTRSDFSRNPPLEKVNFLFMSCHQLEIVSALEVEGCVSLQTQCTLQISEEEEAV